MDQILFPTVLKLDQYRHVEAIFRFAKIGCKPSDD